MHILMSVVEPVTNNSQLSVQDHQSNSWVVIVDGMGELQALDKPIAVKTCKDLLKFSFKKFKVNTGNMMKFMLFLIRTKTNRSRSLLELKGFMGVY